MIIGIFARPNHPAGYGFGGGTAHGYVLAIVACANAAELQRVRNAMIDFSIDQKGGLRWAGRGNDDDWYSGGMDLVGTIHEEGEPVPTIQDDKGVLAMSPGGHWRSLGDNRAVAFLTAQQALEACS